jgi:hypothetical protein
VTITRTVTAFTIAASIAATPADCQGSSIGGGHTATANVGGHPTARVDVNTARRQLAELAASAEDTGNHYRRADWPHWDQVGGGCDARENALRTQGRAVTRGPGCRITGGTWVSRTTGPP